MTKTDASTFIRRGRRDEAKALANLHVAVWRATYRDYAPKAALEELDVAKRLPYWSLALTSDEPGFGVWVAEKSGSIVGVVSIGKSENRVFNGRAEIKHLYVTQSAQGQGLGKNLLKTALSKGVATGCPGMALSVVRQNTLARRFYARMGGCEIDTFTDLGPLWRSDNVLVAWDDFRAPSGAPDVPSALIE